MSESNVLTKALTDTVLTRRSFLKWSAALGGTAALAGGVSFGLKAATNAAAADEGSWLPVACWHNCGGRCANYALVKDGTVVRQKTDDTHPDSPDFPQQRGCARGRSQRRQVYGADRLKYPMKRAHWAPGGGDKSLRGRDEWVRISWDEALNIVASELKAAKEKYGNASIFLPRSSSRLISAFGGYMDTWGVTSEGAWPQVVSKMTGGIGASSNDRMQYRKTKLVVMFGSNPGVSSNGNPAYNYYQAKKAGAKFIMISPELNHTTMPLADEWIPVRPSQDTALLLGIAHYLIANNLVDQEFLDTYTLGFDAEHMPEGADPKENFKDYVLGTYDGVPKTPAWASQLCGTPVRMIESLALQMGTVKPMILQSSWAPARVYRGEQFCQAFFTVGWMTGNVGLPGAGVYDIGHSGASYGGPRLVSNGGAGLPGIPNPLAGGIAVGYGFSEPTNRDFQAIAYEEFWDAILNDKYHATVRGEIPCNIRVIYRVQDGNGANALNQQGGTVKGIEAFRKVDFVVVSDIVLSTTAKYADVVLPTTTPWEQDFGGFATGNPEMLLFYQQVTEPLFEARDLQWIERELAPRLGLNPDDIFPFPRRQQVFNQILGAKVALPDASGTEPLVTVTADDLAKYGVTGEPQQGRITLDELMTKGVYQVERKPGDAFEYVAAKAFRADPAANPVKTTTGKLEIHSQTLADHIAAYGFTTIDPIAKYQPSPEGYEGTLSGDFPLQICNPHNLRRSHSVFDNIIQLRRAFPQEVWINPLDAEPRGLVTGDTILVSSPHGKVIRHAMVTPRVMPGVITLSEGAWVQMDEEKGIDRAGCTNVLCGATKTGQGHEPWNTCIAQVAKYDGPALEADYTWPQRIPIKEA